MAIIVRNTNYSGEVLEQLLTLAATSNEIVEKGLIMVIPGVEKKNQPAAPEDRQDASEAQGEPRRGGFEGQLQLRRKES